MQANERVLSKLGSLLKSKIVTAVGSVMLAMLAIFTLSAWAEVAAWHHALQHVFIFAAGMGLGSSLFIRKQEE